MAKVVTHGQWLELITLPARDLIRIHEPNSLSDGKYIEFTIEEADQLVEELSTKLLNLEYYNRLHNGRYPHERE